MKHTTHNQSGFTLIELIVAITVFVIFVTMATAAYIAIMRAQFEANETRKLYAEAQQFISLVSQEMREKTVDYGCYADHTCKPAMGTGEFVGQLALRSIDGDDRAFYYLDGNQIKKMTYRYEDDQDIYLDNFDDAAMTGSHIDITNLQFKIEPKENPHENVNNAAMQFQPTVTLYLEAKNPKLGEERPPLSFQTTVTTRVYSKPTLDD